jgi:hypothetical protein
VWVLGACLVIISVEMANKNKSSKSKARNNEAKQPNSLDTKEQSPGKSTQS